MSNIPPLERTPLSDACTGFRYIAHALSRAGAANADDPLVKPAIDLLNAVKPFILAAVREPSP